MFSFWREQELNIYKKKKKITGKNSIEKMDGEISIYIDFFINFRQKVQDWFVKNQSSLLLPYFRLYFQRDLSRFVSGMMYTLPSHRQYEQKMIQQTLTRIFYPPFFIFIYFFFLSIRLINPSLLQ